MIYTNRNPDAQATKEEMDAVMAAYNAFGEQFHEQLTGGAALNPTSSATTVRVRDGQKLTTDGPFAKIKEQLGGFHLIKATAWRISTRSCCKRPARTRRSAFAAHATAAMEACAAVPMRNDDGNAGSSPVRSTISSGSAGSPTSRHSPSRASRV